jgi:hypothetical protein
VSSSTAGRILRWTGKALLWLVVALLVLAVIGAIYQAIATQLDERAYPPPGMLVDVGGPRLHIRCAGQGTPTVILEAANLGMSAHWVRVQQQVAKTTRVCAYDRAGLGWSEPGPERAGGLARQPDRHDQPGPPLTGPKVPAGKSATL